MEWEAIDIILMLWKFPPPRIFVMACEKKTDFQISGEGGGEYAIPRDKNKC